MDYVVRDAELTNRLERGLRPNGGALWQSDCVYNSRGFRSSYGYSLRRDRAG